MPLKESIRKQGNWLFKYRSYLPLIIIIIGLILYIYPIVFQQKPLPNTITSSLIYFIIGLLGLFIRFHVVGYAAENTSGKNTHEQKADTVNSTGMYSIVRHPLYLGNFLMWLSATLLVGNIWFTLVFCLTYWLYYERIMYAEEEYLREKFGDNYLQWANSVPAFIPKIKQYRKPSLKFRCAKAIRSEKNSFAALCILFTLFDVLGNLLTKENNFNYIFISFTAISLLLYAVLKVQKIIRNKK